MSTTEVLTPPSTSAATVSAATRRHRYHSEGETSESQESRRKRAIRKKRLQCEEQKHHHHQHNHSGGGRNARRRAKRCHKNGNANGASHHLQPMAPYNTTQFLLDDRVEREHNSDEEQVMDDTVGTAVVDHRFRCYSVSSEPNNHSSSDHSASDEEMDNNMERDFEADFESVKLERLDSMSRDEVTRAMLQIEKSHGDLADHVVELRCENAQLKKLLNQNGIPFQPPARRRRSSNESSLGSNASTSNSNDEKPE